MSVGVEGNFVVMAVTVCTLLAVTPLGSAAIAQEKPNSQPRVQDFRTKTQASGNHGKQTRVVPAFDKSYVHRHLGSLMQSVDLRWKSFLNPGVDSLRPRQPLSYHVVVRIEAIIGNKTSLAKDLHFPPRLGDPKKLKQQWSSSYIEDPYIKSLVETHGDHLDDAIEDFALKSYIETLGKAVAKVLNDHERYGDLRPEPDPKRADLLVHINLSDRKQVSHGFTFEEMPKYPQRRFAGKPGGDLEEILYALPWTFVRIYSGRDPSARRKRSIVGGEIWIQYPLRTVFQESVARIVLADLKFAQQLGLGATRNEIIGTFRTPHETNLQPFALAHGQQRPYSEFSPRPGETLLSISTAVKQDFEGHGTGIGGPDSRGRLLQSAKQKLPNVTTRLFRAMALVTSGLRMGGQLVSPNGDYGAEFSRDPSSFLASLSLMTYPQAFDERFRDRLSLIVLEEMRKAHKDRPLHALVDVRDRKRHEASHHNGAFAREIRNKRQTDIYTVWTQARASFADMVERNTLKNRFLTPRR